MSAQGIKPEPPLGEFVALMALMISLVALSIDAMLPALGQIGTDLDIQRDNDSQLVITALLFGLGTAQMVYGPLSDSIGRKAAIYIGFALFIIGCILSMVATNLTVMLIGRVLQGVGAAGPRIVTIALVRDKYEGRAMARIMSLVMGVFIIVPMLAPVIGQLILFAANWRAIFGAFLVLALIAVIWFRLRQPETLPPEGRVPFSLARIGAGIRETCANRTAMAYMIAAGLVFGAFVGYLNSAQQIFQQQYGQGELFALYFAVLALAIGAASFLNAKLVMRFGMRLLSLRALWILCVSSLGFLAFTFWTDGDPPLWSLMVYLSVVFFSLGILFGNFNALAMEPLGHIAGVAAAVIGSLTTFMSVIFGTWIGLSFDGTVLPLVVGFALLGTASFGVMTWAERTN